MQQSSVSFTFTVIGALIVQGAPPPSATQGQAYSYQFAAAGGTAPYTFSATGLPAGMSMSASGLLSGTPASAGAFSVTVTVSDAG